MNIDPTDAVNSELSKNILSFVPQVEAGGQIPPIPSRILSRILELPTWYPEWNPVNPTYNSDWDLVLIYRWDAFSARYNSRRDPAPPPQKSGKKETNNEPPISYVYPTFIINTPYSQHDVQIFCAKCRTTMFPCNLMLFDILQDQRDKHC